MATLRIGERSYEVEVRGDTVVVDGHDLPVSVQTVDGVTTVTAGGVRYRVELPPEDSRASGMRVEVDHRPFSVEWEGSLGGGAARPQRRAISDSGPALAGGGAAVKGGVSAQIAGRVVALKVKVGDTVAAGDVLLLLEAMKMENEIRAPAAGTVASILVTEGQRVREGETLVVIE
jgi:biotin carboxyl carrier protein